MEKGKVIKYATHLILFIFIIFLFSQRFVSAQTISPTLTITPSLSPSVSPTPTDLSPTISPSITPSVSPTPSISMTPTPTHEPSPTLVPSPSPTRSLTPTVTPSPHESDEDDEDDKDDREIGGVANDNNQEGPGVGEERPIENSSEDSAIPESDNSILGVIDTTLNIIKPLARPITRGYYEGSDLDRASYLTLMGTSLTFLFLGTLLLKDTIFKNLKEIFSNFNKKSGIDNKLSSHTVFGQLSE